MKLFCFVSIVFQFPSKEYCRSIFSASYHELAKKIPLGKISVLVYKLTMPILWKWKVLVLISFCEDHSSYKFFLCCKKKINKKKSVAVHKTYNFPLTHQLLMRRFHIVLIKPTSYKSSICDSFLTTSHWPPVCLFHVSLNWFTVVKLSLYFKYLDEH